MKNIRVEIKGQVFTPAEIVLRMISLRKNKGNVLEPSAGDGAFSRHFKKDVVVSVEKEKAVIKDKGTLNMDFFDFPTKEKFDTIIGNPPYVKHNNIEGDTLRKLDYTFFDKRTNLYLFFIEKCLRHLRKKGEMILIVPREFINLTSAKKLNELLCAKGTITDYIDLGDQKIFADACPNVAIFRFQKDCFDRKTNRSLTFNCINGKILFTGCENKMTLGELFDVKVGAVSGADSIFTDDSGNASFVCSYTAKTGKTKRMFFNVKHRKLSSHKEALLKRKIKKFDEKNWYMWGRNHFISNEPRIYVNCKTRNKTPFFTHRSEYYDGSVLALFPKREMNIKRYIDILNKVDWEKQGFVCNGRYLFTQRSLTNALIKRSHVGPDAGLFTQRSLTNTLFNSNH